jgi:putative hydrolase of the HAD superfamily
MWSKIQNIIFDISNVVVDVNVSLTHQAMFQLCKKDFSHPSQIIDNKALLPYETGNWSDDFFRNELRKQLQNPAASDTALDNAWNCMLLPIPQERLDFLLKLRHKYRIFALSNIDSIHSRGIDQKLALYNNWLSGLSGIFEKVYFSYQIHKSKPAPETFLTVLSENNLSPDDTLFIDDKAENTEAASLFGMHTLLFKPEEMKLSELPLLNN